MGFLYQTANFLARLISLYSFFIWIRIFLTWVNPYPRQGTITWYFAKMVDPYLNLFRSRHFRVGMLDFSPLFAIAVLQVGQSILQLFSFYGTLRLSWFLQLLISAVWSYGVSVFMMIAIMLLIFKTIASFTHSPMLSRMGMAVDPLVRKMQDLLFPRRLVKESTITLITLVVAFLCYFGLKYAFIMLSQLSMRIPF